MAQNNRSLLPAGVVKVEGDFEQGDVVAIHAADGRLLARGLTNYAATDVDKIRGKKSAEVRSLLHEAAYDEVVHREGGYRSLPPVRPHGTLIRNLSDISRSLCSSVM